MAQSQERYVLERRLAIGGMAEIFLGRVAGLEGFEKKVVLKRMLPTFEDRPDFVEMFLDEARLAGRFHHPNLVAVHELTKIDGLYCLAMEYIEGEDLDNVLDTCDRRDRLLDVEVAAYLIAEVADALHYAHELTTDDGQPLNVVHRDISPANIIVTLHGGVKLVDFGIAKSEAGRTQTQTGIVKGKFSYMSPEQIAGKRLDRRSDIFSLGAVLYEALTLERCFRRDTPMATIQAITHGDIAPLQEARPEVPDRLAEITHSMMALERDDRPSSADAVSQDLRRFLLDRQSPNPAAIRMLMRELFEATKVRGYSAIGGQGTVEVTGELAGPEVSVSEAAYREMVDAVTVPGSDYEVIDDADVPTTVRAETPVGPEVLVGEASTTLDLGPVDVTTEPTAIVQREPSAIPPIHPLLLSATTSKDKAFPRRQPWWRKPGTWAGLGVPALIAFLVVMAMRWPDPAKSTVEALPPTTTSRKSPQAEPAPKPTPEPALEPATEPAPEPATEPPASTPEPTDTPAYAAPATRPRAKSGPTTRPEAQADAKRVAEAAKGILLVSSEPPTTVTVDGKRIGETPARAALTPGSHIVRVSNDTEGLSRNLKIRVRAGQTTKRELLFKKGTVMVKSTPWAQVYLRGKKLGSTPMVTELYEGNHTLRLVSPSSGLEKLVKITVKPGEKTKVDETF